MTPYERTLLRANAARLLGVSPSAERSEIRQAWKRRVLDLHPDLGRGTDDQFVAVNTAYRHLLECTETAAPANDTEGRNVRQPQRPTVDDRARPINECEQLQCRQFLETEGLGGQVPVLVRRAGRRITYLFDTPMAANANRVAVLAGEMVDKRKIRPVLVEFDASVTDREVFEVSDDMRQRLFPGAKSVRLQFACAR